MEVEVKQCVDVKTTYVKVLTSTYVKVYVKTKKAMSAELRIAGASMKSFLPISTKVCSWMSKLRVKTKKATSAELRIAGASNEIFSPNIHQSLF